MGRRPRTRIKDQNSREEESVQIVILNRLHDDIDFIFNSVVRSQLLLSDGEHD